MKRKICVVTGTRAEFGLLRWLMQDIARSDGLELRVVATGMHLSPEFGLTYREIEQAGFGIDSRVELLMSSDTPTGVSKAMGLGLIGFGDVYARMAPDLIVVLGDRFEIFAAAAAALVAGIPIAHLHGGELTEGAFDDAMRHSITKMSHLHFVAAEEYRRRVIQLGEDPRRVFTVGGLGVDAITKIELLGREELEKSMDFKFQSQNLMVTFHPVTLEQEGATQQMIDLLAVLEELENTGLIFTMPNSDTGGRELMALVEGFVARHPHTRAYPSLGQLRYLSCLRHVDGVVGNSSSGLAEAPSMGIGTINIGDRQRGRLMASSVIQCEPSMSSIRSALSRLYDPEFRALLPSVRNPYGTGGAAKQIVEVLENHPLDGLLKKTFFDLAGFSESR